MRPVMLSVTRRILIDDYLLDINNPDPTPIVWANEKARLEIGKEAADTERHLIQTFRTERGLVPLPLN